MHGELTLREVRDFCEKYCGVCRGFIKCGLLITDVGCRVYNYPDHWDVPAITAAIRGHEADELDDESKDRPFSEYKVADNEDRFIELIGKLKADIAELESYKDYMSRFYEAVKNIVDNWR